MCCRNRRARREPLFVTLGKFAYDKYQQKQERDRAVQALEQPGFETRVSRSPSPDYMQQNANAEILQKAGIQPPNYNDVVVNRAELPDYQANEKASDEENLRDDLSDTESFMEVFDGRRRPTNEMRFAGNEGFVASKSSGCGSTWAERRAAKMQRKAEKATARAEKAQAKVAGLRM